MTNEVDKQIAAARGYYEKAHWHGKSAAENAPLEYRNNIDLQLAWKRGWKEAEDEQPVQMNVSMDFTKPVIEMMKELKELREDIAKLQRAVLANKGPGGAASVGPFDALWRHNPLGSNHWFEGLSGAGGPGGAATGGGGNVAAGGGSARTGIPGSGGDASGCYGSVESKGGGGNGWSGGNGGGGTKPEHVYLDPGAYTVEHDGDNWIINAKADHGEEIIQSPTGELAHVYVDYGSGIPDGLKSWKKEIIDRYGVDDVKEACTFDTAIGKDLDGFADFYNIHPRLEGESDLNLRARIRAAHERFHPCGQTNASKTAVEAAEKQYREYYFGDNFRAPGQPRTESENSAYDALRKTARKYLDHLKGQDIDEQAAKHEAERFDRLSKVPGLWWMDAAQKGVADPRGYIDQDVVTSASAAPQAGDDVVNRWKAWRDINKKLISEKEVLSRAELQAGFKPADDAFCAYDKPDGYHQRQPFESDEAFRARLKRLAARQCIENAASYSDMEFNADGTIKTQPLNMNIMGKPVALSGEGHLPDED